MIPLMPYEKSEDLLLPCLMDKSTLILVICNVKETYLCFSLIGICQALTLSISPKQSKEKLTIGQHCSSLEHTFDLISPNFGVDGFWSSTVLHMRSFHMLLCKAPTGDLSNRFHNNFTAQ